MYDLSKIGFYTLKNERAENTSVYSDLWRCELILTNRCNFKCPYCRGFKEEDKKELTLEEAKDIVDLWISNNIHNIRFSGGEPTVWPYLLELVEYTKNKGKKCLKHIAISTNGSADLNYYYKLVDAGINDFSISLDSCCASTAEVMAGINVDFEKIKYNIKRLSELTYVTVGVVLEEKNIEEINNIISLSDNLEVSDIRIIPSSQWNQKIKSKISNDILKKYPILEYRIENINDGKDIRGISDTNFRKCPLVLDDMAVLNGKHYPCIIYMREQGKEIGKINKDISIKQIREERKDWYKKHDCFDDDICKKNCLDVCIAYNNKVAEYIVKKQKKVRRLDSSLFTWNLHNSGSVNEIFNIRSRYYNILENKEILRKYVDGYCFSEELNIKPKENQIAVMFCVDDNYFWNHFRISEFIEIFCEI